jgi:cytochrome c oxidase cbb3-type subunit 3
MSDFVNSGWAWFVGGATILGLLGCLWLLSVASKRQVMAADNSTGHVFDEDLVEMNHPLPRWWMVLFILTVLFALAYLVLYPGLGSYAGQWNWTSKNQLEAERARADTEVAAVYARYRAMPAAQLVRDPSAMAIGERLFINNSAASQCTEAKGSNGFPNQTQSRASRLTSGEPEAIEATITEGRQGMMPVMADAVGSAEDVRNVANYVLSLSGSPHNAIAAAAGQSKFGACAACHGVGGKGNQALGAPNLADKIWLHGWGEDAIVDIVTHGKTNTMPSQRGRLTPEQIHVLAGYAWKLSQSTLDPTAPQATQRP